MRAALLLFALLATAIAARPLHHDLEDHGFAGEGHDRPNILFVMLDDVGIASLGFSARQYPWTPTAANPVWFERQFANFTPALDRLASEGIVLNRHMGFAECTPSRQAFLAGRLPIHNGVVMREPIRWDGGASPNDGYDGLSPNITSLADKLLAAGYATHVTGKVDGFGQATSEHTPLGRGFVSGLTFFNHGNDVWNYTIGVTSIGYPPWCQNTTRWPGGPLFVDMFLNNSTAKGSPYFVCNGATPEEACTFEEDVLKQRVLDIIHAQTPRSPPFFVLLSSRAAHTPLQAPRQYIDYLLSVCGPTARGPFAGQCSYAERYVYLSMIKQFDDSLGDVIRTLKTRGLWDKTLVVFQADNGGPIGFPTGGNNFPLRGGKSSSWDGGFRTPAFVSGGALPRHLRGTTYGKATMISDWYATFCELAHGTQCTGWGADPTGEVVPGIVPVESVNLWDYLTGQRRGSPHPVLPLSPTALLAERNGTLWKLITGISPYNMLTSPLYPNCTVCQTPCLCNAEQTAQCSLGNNCVPCTVESLCNPPNSSNIPCQACSSMYPNARCCNTDERPATGNPNTRNPPLPFDCGQGCLFNMDADITESHDLCSALPLLCTDLQSLLYTQNLTYYEPFRGCPMIQLSCDAASNQFNGTYGPFVNVANCSSCVHTTAAYRANPTYPITSNSCNCYPDRATCILGQGGLCQWNDDTQTCDYRAHYNESAWKVLRRWSLANYDAREFD